jgi:beta-phosphoglucomutase
MKGVIFDLDGTIVDNMMVHHRAWQRKLKQLGLDLELSEVMQKVLGVDEEILESIFGDQFTAAERKQHSFEKEEEYRRIFKDDLKLITGLPALLDQLKENFIPLAIGSAAPPENVNFVLDNLNLRNYFDVVLHARDVTVGKPNPEIYLKAADKLGLKIEDCFIFEDSPVGAEAAQRAGSHTLIITTTHSKSEFTQFPNVVKFIKDYSELDFNQLLNMEALK